MRSGGLIGRLKLGDGGGLDRGDVEGADLGDLCGFLGVIVGVANRVGRPLHFLEKDRVFADHLEELRFSLREVRVSGAHHLASDLDTDLLNLLLDLRHELLAGQLDGLLLQRVGEPGFVLID